MTTLETFLLAFILGTYINYTVRHVMIKTHHWDTPILYLLAGIPFFPLVLYLLQKQRIVNKVEEKTEKEDKELQELLDEFVKRAKERNDKNGK
jgi:hypothetical protein